MAARDNVKGENIAEHNLDTTLKLPLIQEAIR